MVKVWIMFRIMIKTWLRVRFRVNLGLCLIVG
jgi:hypothetical protein